MGSFPRQAVALTPATGNSSSNVYTGTFSKAVLKGSALVVFSQNNDAVTSATIVDDVNRTTWPAAKETQNDTNATSLTWINAWVFENTLAGTPTVQITFGGSTSFRALWLVEMANARVLDKHASQIQAGPGTGTDAVTSGNTATLTTQPNGHLAFSMNTNGSVGPPTAGSTYTTDEGPGWAWDLGFNTSRVEFKNTTSTAAAAGTFTAITGTDRFTTIVLVFLDDLEITSQPTDQYFNPQSGSVTFTVVATASAGGGSLSYQWYRNGVLISGATSSSYTFTATYYDEGASYTCVVTDSNTSKTSDAAHPLMLPGGFDVYLYQGYPLSANDVVLRDPTTFDHLPFWGVEMPQVYDQAAIYRRPIGDEALSAATPPAAPASFAPLETTPKFTPSRTRSIALADPVPGLTPKTPVANWYDEDRSGKGQAPRARTDEAVVFPVRVVLATYFDDAPTRGKAPRARTDEAVGVTPKTPLAPWYDLDFWRRGAAPRARTDEALVLGTKINAIEDWIPRGRWRPGFLVAELFSGRPITPLAPWFEQTDTRGQAPRARTDEAVGLTPKTPTFQWYEDSRGIRYQTRARLEIEPVFFRATAVLAPWFEQTDTRGKAPRARTDEAVGLTPKTPLFSWFEATETRGRQPRARTDESNLFPFKFTLFTYFDDAPTRGRQPRARTEEALGLTPKIPTAVWIEDSSARAGVRARRYPVLEDLVQRAAATLTWHESEVVRRPLPALARVALEALDIASQKARAMLDDVVIAARRVAARAPLDSAWDISTRAAALPDLDLPQRRPDRRTFAIAEEVVAISSAVRRTLVEDPVFHHFYRPASSIIIDPTFWGLIVPPPRHRLPPWASSSRGSSGTSASGTHGGTGTAGTGGGTSDKPVIGSGSKAVKI